MIKKSRINPVFKVVFCLYLSSYMITLSIVIPVFNEETKIARDILAADRFLVSENLSGEIIIVDDGSGDRTRTLAEKTAAGIQTPCVIERFEHNYGKGRAVRTGILKSRGDYVLFADSGLCVRFAEALSGVALIRSGHCQIAHGSRKLSGCHILRPQTLYRKICSRLFHWFLIHDIKLLGNLTDTQCGFKVYSGPAARQLYAESSMDRFMFDIEIILLALARGYTIKEFAVDWTCDPDSRLKPAKEVFGIFKDVMTLKRQFRNLPSPKRR
ncbi:MAG: glycosyltransferase [Planctomycetota bacterium]